MKAPPISCAPWFDCGNQPKNRRSLPAHGELLLSFNIDCAHYIRRVSRALKANS